MSGRGYTKNMNRQGGLTLIEILIAVGLVILVSGGVYFFINNSDAPAPVPDTPIDTKDDTTQAVPAPGFENVPEMIVGGGEDDFEPESDSSEEPNRIENEEPSDPLPVQIVEKVEWINGYNGWESNGTPPVCPSLPLLEIPVNLSQVSSILYPGQYRSGNYKPHGGFRFDNTPSDKVTVRAPMDAKLVDGGRYLGDDGEIQYTFDFIAPCGIWYRFGHVLNPSQKLLAIAESFPEAVKGNTRTYGVSPYVEFTAGEIIATAAAPEGLDWGVYDLRSKNSASQDSAWVALHTGQQAQNAVCWFDLLSSEDEAIVRSLPPSGASGSMSDYCL